MIKTILTIIFITMALFDIFMVTPFGMAWTLKSLDEGKCCYGAIIMFVTAIPMMLIGTFLGFI